MRYVADQHDQKPTEGRAGTLENDQRPERAPATSSDHGHEGAVGSKGPVVINASKGFKTAGEARRAGSSINGQHPECIPSTSVNQGHEKDVYFKGANAERSNAPQQPLT